MSRMGIGATFQVSTLLSSCTTNAIHTVFPCARPGEITHPSLWKLSDRSSRPWLGRYQPVNPIANAHTVLARYKLNPIRRRSKPPCKWSREPNISLRPLSSARSFHTEHCHAGKLSPSFKFLTKGKSLASPPPRHMFKTLKPAGPSETPLYICKIQLTTTSERYGDGVERVYSR